MTRPVGPCPARIMVVGEAPGVEDAKRGEPFIGYSGQELSRMLSEAGISRNACLVTNFIRVPPPEGDVSLFFAKAKKDITPSHFAIRDKHVLQPVWEGLDLLKREIEMCQPHVIIALGNAAMWALTGKWGITSWRGSMLQCDLDLALDYKPKVLPTYSPASIMRQWSWRPIAVTDLRRANIMAQSRELQRPDYKFCIRPEKQQVLSILKQLYDQLEAQRLRAQ